MTQAAAMEAEKRESARARRRLSQAGLNASTIERFLDDVLEVDWHAATLRSVSFATLGVLHAASLCIHVIGRAFAWDRDKLASSAATAVHRLRSWTAGPVGWNR